MADWEFVVIDGQLRVVEKPLNGYVQNVKGTHLTFSLKKDGSVVYHGKVTDGTPQGVLQDLSTPTIIGEFNRVTRLFPGSHSVCGLQDGNALVCVAEIEQYDSPEDSTPSSVAIAPPFSLASGGVSKVRQGLQTCFLREGRVFCSYLLSRDGRSLTSELAVIAPIVGAEDFCVTPRAGGLPSGCALIEGALECWGAKWGDEPAAADPAQSPAVARKMPLGGKAVALACGEEAVAALTATGEVWHSTSKPSYQDGVTPFTRVPAFPRVTTLTKVEAGELCALDAAGDLYCCGNILGVQVGTGLPPACVPVKIPVVGPLAR